MAKKSQIDPEQPTWICYDCGQTHGVYPLRGVATWHTDICGVCGKEKVCTEPRDFGYLLKGWKNKSKEEQNNG